MNSLLENSPTMALASFVSRRAIPPSFENVSSAHELDFLKFREIYAEDYYFPRPLYSKMVIMPDRSFHAHIHYSLQNEKRPKSNNRYIMFNVSNKDAYILHIRYLV
jgi:hypothetical protein